MKLSIVKLTLCKGEPTGKPRVMLNRPAKMFKINYFRKLILMDKCKKKKKKGINGQIMNCYLEMPQTFSSVAPSLVHFKLHKNMH